METAPYTKAAPAPRVGDRLLEALVLLTLLVPAFLEAGYHAALGSADADGRPVGFNDPVHLSHLPLFARSLSADALWSGFAPWVLAAVLAQGLLNRIPLLPRRMPRIQGATFLLLEWGGLGWKMLEGHQPRGECVIEGEWSPVMALLIWAAAWIPAVLAVLPWGRLRALLRSSP